MSEAALSAFRTRRTHYALTSKSTVPDSEIVSLAEQALLHVPSAFNSQSTRLTILFHSEHTYLWSSIVGPALLQKIGEERYNSGSKARIEGFSGGYATILFWDSLDVVNSLAANAPPIYSDKVQEWRHQSNGMHQYFMWVALTNLGMGVNLQHYNPLIDDAVKEKWGIPKEWDLKAQMVFGVRREGTTIGEKAKEQKLKISERLGVFGAEK